MDYAIEEGIFWLISALGIVTLGFAVLLLAALVHDAREYLFRARGRVPSRMPQLNPGLAGGDRGAGPGPPLRDAPPSATSASTLGCAS